MSQNESIKKMNDACLEETVGGVYPGSGFNLRDGLIGSANPVQSEYSFADSKGTLGKIVVGYAHPNSGMCVRNEGVSMGKPQQDQQDQQDL